MPHHWKDLPGWGCEQPDLVEGVPAHGEGMELVDWNYMITTVPSNPNHVAIL